MPRKIDVADAISSARSWVQVADALDISHLSGAPGRQAVSEELSRAPRILRAPACFSPPHGSSSAASGHEVSWPLEPCRYDLLAWMGGKPERIQVKTTRSRNGRSWTVWISNSRNGQRRVDDPDEVDRFFIIDGDLAYYLIPVQMVGGLNAVQLDAYQMFRLPRM